MVRSVVVSALTVVSVVSSAGCVIEPDIEGSFHAEQTRVGSWEMFPDTCLSGDRRDFFGADFSEEETDLYVRIVEDPIEGFTVVAFDPDEIDSIPIQPPMCRRFLVRLEKSATEEDGVEGVEGHLDLDCQPPDGGTFYGRVDFRRCY